MARLMDIRCTVVSRRAVHLEQDKRQKVIYEMFTRGTGYCPTAISVVYNHPGLEISQRQEEVDPDIEHPKWAQHLLQEGYMKVSHLSTNPSGTDMATDAC